MSERWEHFFAFNATGLSKLPIVDTRNKTLPLSRELDRLAHDVAALQPLETIRHRLPTAESLEANRREAEGSRPGWCVIKRSSTGSSIACTG